MQTTSSNKTIPLKEARARLKLGRDFMRAEIQRGAFRVYRPNSRVVLVYVESIERYESAKSA